MYRIANLSVLTLAAVVATPPLPAVAQEGASDLREELLEDFNDLQEKVVSLAEAMPADRYDWSPMEGVRTVGQVYLHIASSNYLFPTFAGVAPSSSASVTADPESVRAFEAGGTKEEVLAKLRDSFEYLIAGLGETPDWDRRLDFGRSNPSVRLVWLWTVTHIHEHLGQAIAYARMNRVVPPWSR